MASSASALVCGEYSSGEEELEQQARAKQSDVNYEEVGMDMGSSCSSGAENDGNDENINEKQDSIDAGLFSSKDEYEAYHTQFASRPPARGNKGRSQNEKLKKNHETVSEYGAGDIDSEYGGGEENASNKQDKNTHSEYVDDENYGDRDEYGGWQPSKSAVSNKPKNGAARNSSSPSTTEPQRRGNSSKEKDGPDSFTPRDEEKQKQHQKRPSLSGDKRLKDKLLSLSQEEPSSSGSERSGNRAHHTSSRKSRSQSKEKNKSHSPKATSRRRSRSRTRSRSRSQERRRERGHHRSSHHRSSKHHHHHHRDHRDRDRGRYDRGRDRRGNDGRRDRDRIAEDQRQELRNKKLVNLGITSNAVLEAACQSGNLDLRNPDAAAMRAQQMISKQLEAQVAKAKEVTGVELPSYYNPSVINPLKYADQIKKRKLLWGSSGGGTGVRQPLQSEQGQSGVQAVEDNDAQNLKSHEEVMQSRKSLFDSTSSVQTEKKQSFNKWESTNFGDDKATDKFRRLMGIRSGAAPTASDGDKKHPSSAVPGDKTAKFFQEQEAQYEKARAITHTQRGLGLGFSGVQQEQQQHEHLSTLSAPQPQHQPPPAALNPRGPQRSLGETLGFVKKSA